MNPSFITAARKAEQVRIKLSIDSFQPVNIFDICISLDVTVRFVDINMEGMYIAQTSGKYPTILLSNQRPLSRRVFTCAHELGHHLFGHGSKMDVLADHTTGSGAYNNEEWLVDTFAGLLLMPISSVIAEFNRRNWQIENASQLNFYTISSFFGVGYQTLISHCKANRLLTEARASFLLKTSPSKLLASIGDLELPTAPFKIIDGISAPQIIDVETLNYIFLPFNTEVEGDHLERLLTSALGDVFVAKKPGVVRVYSSELDFGSFVRIHNTSYLGLAENRNLENDID